MLLSQDSTKKEEAVRVLIGISKQGNNKEATVILTKCLEEREGITPENQDDVKWCVKTSEEEKRLRHAVEELYNSMKKDGEDKVAVQDIDEAMKRAEAKLKVRYLQLVTNNYFTSSVEFLYVQTCHISLNSSQEQLLLNYFLYSEWR